MSSHRDLPSAPLGIFDSGFGGLDVARGIRSAFPDLDLLYLGDTARAPYGTRSKRCIEEFTREGVDFLLRKGAPLVILACNTASSDALHEIQQQYLPAKYPNRNVLGVLIPAAEEAVRVTRSGRIGIIATPSTVASGAFVREIRKFENSLSIRTFEVFQKPCPLLVPLVEAGEDKTPIAQEILKHYLTPFIEETRIDTLILGCTHYGLLEQGIRKIIGPNIAIINESRAVPERLREYLDRHSEYDHQLSREGNTLCFTTDQGLGFETLAPRFFGAPLQIARVAHLHDNPESAPLNREDFHPLNPHASEK